MYQGKQKNQTKISLHYVKLNTHVDNADCRM